jgi:hypothetical protein
MSYVSGIGLMMMSATPVQIPQKPAMTQHNLHVHLPVSSLTTWRANITIKYLKAGLFAPCEIALMVLLPLLLSVIAVGVLVGIHFLRKIKRLNVIIHQLIYKQQKYVGLSTS